MIVLIIILTVISVVSLIVAIVSIVTSNNIKKGFVSLSSSFTSLSGRHDLLADENETLQSVTAKLRKDVDLNSERALKALKAVNMSDYEKWDQHLIENKK